MTKTIFGSLLSHVAGLTHSVVEIYKLSPVGMTTFAWTDSNADISFRGLIYSPWPLKRSKISFSSDFKTDQTEVTVAKNLELEDAIDKDILTGADFEIIRVRVDNPDSDYTIMFSGEVANVQIGEMELTLGVHTLDFLNLEVPKRDYQVMCNWKLYDEFCTVDARGWLVGSCFSATSVDGKTLTAIAFADEANNHWTQGYIRATSGQNEEIKREVSSHSGQTITVVPPFPQTISAEDTFQIYPGCAHNLDDCENKFHNLINYGGFPFIPRQDDVL